MFLGVHGIEHLNHIYRFQRGTKWTFDELPKARRVLTQTYGFKCSSIFKHKNEDKGSISTRTEKSACFRSNSTYSNFPQRLSLTLAKASLYTTRRKSAAVSKIVCARFSAPQDAESNILSPCCQSTRRIRRPQNRPHPGCALASRRGSDADAVRA